MNIRVAHQHSIVGGSAPVPGPYSQDREVSQGEVLLAVLWANRFCLRLAGTPIHTPHPPSNPLGVWVGFFQFYNLPGTHFMRTCTNGTTMTRNELISSQCSHSAVCTSTRSYAQCLKDRDARHKADDSQTREVEVLKRIVLK